VNRYGGDMARFLSNYPPARERPYLADVARLEWAIDQANIAADAPALDLPALGAVPVDALGGLRFALHEGADLLLVRRAPDGVVIERLAPGEHAFLVALARSRRLDDAEQRGAAAESAFDLAVVLKRHVAAQTIVAFRAPSPLS